MAKRDKKVAKRSKNITWQNNQALIQTAYLKLIKILKRCPTVLEVSKEVNISIEAINRHIKEMKFKTLESPLRALTPDVLVAIYNSARKGSSASQKLWVQLMEGWREGIDIKGDIKTTPDFSKLSDEQLKQLAELTAKLGSPSGTDEA